MQVYNFTVSLVQTPPTCAPTQSTFRWAVRWAEMGSDVLRCVTFILIGDFCGNIGFDAERWLELWRIGLLLKIGIFMTSTIFVLNSPSIFVDHIEPNNEPNNKEQNTRNKELKTIRIFVHFQFLVWIFCRIVFAYRKQISLQQKYFYTSCLLLSMYLKRYGIYPPHLKIGRFFCRWRRGGRQFSRILLETSNYRFSSFS